MEGVSGAASVVAVIAFALSSSKIIHDTISKIKNGPKAIAETTSALEDLWKTLEQIRGLDAEFISVNANLRNVVQKCAADLKECENKIGCLRILPSNKIMSKVLKRVKTMLKQDDFQEMWGKIKWHVSALSLQLLSIQYGMSLAHRNKLHQLDGTLRAAILNASVESKETYKNQLGTIDSLACQQVLNNSAIARTAPPSETTLSQIKYGLEDSQAGTAFSQATTRQCVKEWSNGVEKVRNMSEAQAGTLKAAIELLQDLCPTESSRNLQGSKIHEPSKASADGENDRAQDKLPTEETEEELRTSLERLCSLAAGKERTVFSREAQDIMDNIEHLLNVVSSMMEIRNQKGSEKKRKRQETHCRDHDEPGDEDSQCKRGVKRMKGLLATSQCIAVNSNAASSRTETLGYRYTRKNLHQSHYVGDGTITIHTNSKILKDYNPEAQGDARRSEIPEVFEGAIIYLPNSVPNTRICVSFQQRSTYEGSLLGKPTISFSATLPDNSEVFLRIKDGDKKGLLKLFAEGAASFWDRDSIGRSLLNYACTYPSPDICQYLVQHGADVDAVETQGYSDVLKTCKTTLLHIRPMMHYGGPSEELERSMECRRVLLEADADPMVGPMSEISGISMSHFGSLLDIGTVDSLRLVLDHGRNFIDLEEEDGYGQTSLLRLLASPKVTTEKIDLLLARGANPKAFAKDGCSCLHYCVERSKFSECLGILKLLIRAGADVHAVGDDGTSVTTLAYGTPEKGYRWGKREISNGNRGMIWEQALTDCGYNAADFRQAYLDAGGYVLEDTDYLDLDSDSGKASNDSDGSEAEELTHSGPEGKRLGYAGWKEQQRGVDDQDWDPISVTGFTHVVLPSLQDRTLYPHAGDTDLVLPSVQNTLDWQHTVSEVSPVAASSPCPFRRSFHTLSTQHDHVPIMDTKHADNNPRAWNNSSQSNNESCHQRLPGPSNYQDQQPRTDNTPWDYNFTTHQNKALQPDTWLRIQDLHLLEGDANVWSQ